MLQSEFNALNILNNIGPDTTTPEQETLEEEQTETEEQVEE